MKSDLEFHSLIKLPREADVASVRAHFEQNGIRILWLTQIATHKHIYHWKTRGRVVFAKSHLLQINQSPASSDNQPILLFCSLTQVRKISKGPKTA